MNRPMPTHEHGRWHVASDANDRMVRKSEVDWTLLRERDARVPVSDARVISGARYSETDAGLVQE
eukprot:482202-Rhodomonas_salina.1